MMVQNIVRGSPVFVVDASKPFLQPSLRIWISPPKAFRFVCNYNQHLKRSFNCCECDVKGRNSNELLTGIAKHSHIPAAIFSAIMMVVALVLARITSGIIEASMTIKSSTACISQRGETTAIGSDCGPILQVPDEWC